MKVTGNRVLQAVICSCLWHNKEGSVAHRAIHYGTGWCGLRVSATVPVMFYCTVARVKA